MTAPHPDRHYLPLRNAIPAWLGQASPAKRHAFARGTPQPLPAASAAQRGEFQRLAGAQWTAQNAVDNALNNLQDPKAFAQPLLEDALIRHFGVDLNTQAIYLRLYIPQNLPWLPIASGAARTWTVSLLDAALSNFEHAQTLDSAFEADSTFITRPDARGHFDTLPGVLEKISVVSFARLCRELDIGARYQLYLQAALGFTEPVAGAVLQTKVQTSQKAALRTSLHLAQIQGDIQDDFAQVIAALLDGRPAPMLDNQAVRVHELSMMQVSLTGILLFAANLERTGSVQRLLAYIPDDPQRPLKEYTSALAFKQALTEQLRNADYQAFFSRFVAHAQRGVFFSGLGPRLARIKWHPPEAGSGLAPWRETPTDDPRLQFVATPISTELWQHVYQQHLNKILNDARTLAVPTSAVDQKARWARWDSFVNVAESILNAALWVVAPFIPGLGELMLGYMAYQLLDDAFEGIVDWAEGLPQEAFGHLMSVLQALVQLGAFAAGGSIGVAELRKVLPRDVLDFIDRHKPVSLANGATRYWQPDLKPYQQAIQLPPHLGMDHLGLQQVRRDSLLALEGKLYAVEKHADTQRYVIKHPTRADAYTPALFHNGAGAWHSELDHPLEWDRATLLRRLGHRAQALSPSDRELALSLSAVPEGALRKMHVHSEPLPALLDDSLARLHIDRSLQTLIDRLNSDDPAQQRLVDPQDQLQLLTSFGDWPPSRSLRLLNAQGETTWAFGDSRAPLAQIHEAQLANGGLLQAVLQSLSEEEVRNHFGAPASDVRLSLDTRTDHLRKRLARIAERNRKALFDSRYGLLQQPDEPALRQLMESSPQLPAPCARRLLDHASGEELQALDQRRTPKRLADMAEDAVRALRLNRAYEGLHMDAVQSLDSDRLALNSLRLLPGWSDQVQLELKHTSASGAVWHRIGPDDAPLRRSLVRSDNGRYVPHDDKGPLSGETDLYRAILGALPDAQREALNIQIHQPQLLRERLRQRPLPRHELRQLLDGGGMPEPARETLRLLGNDDGYHAQPPGPHLRQRARELFPGLSEALLDELLARLDNLPRGAANRVAELAEEYLQLDRTLNAWQNEVLNRHPRTDVMLSISESRYEHQNRRLMAAEITRCWRNETAVDDYYEDPTRDGHVLRLDHPILGALPPLQANFDHVTLLSLTGTVDTTGAEAFLGRFARLRHLEVKGIALGDLPLPINNQSPLNTLALSHCHISLTQASHARLAAMSRLQTLVLNGNPLGRVPSVQGMPHLVTLDLSETGIDQLPAGILDLPELQAALLSDNRITELPTTLFEQPAEFSRKFDLSGNPLSRATLEQAKAYFQRHLSYWEIDAPTADVRDARLLYPKLNDDQINRRIFALPGDIEAGKRELARLAAELETLLLELDTWQHPTGLSGAEHNRRLALRRILEESWRRYPNPHTQYVHSLTIPHGLIGELPSLSATFPHVSTLVLEGNGGGLRFEGFLRSFPALDILDVSHAVLGDIPTAVLAQSRLTFLSMTHCSIRLSAASRAGLERMSALQYLDLNHNPLGQAPDFSRMPRLASLQLRATGLREMPAGLLRGQPVPRTIDLSENQLNTLPVELFNLPPGAGHAFNLADNPLSPATLEQIKAYSQQHHEHFNAHAPHVDQARVRALYPNLLDSEVNHFVFSLPGDMQAVGPALGRLEAEYRQMSSDLQQWALNVPERHPLLDVPLDEPTRAQEQLARDYFKTLMEQAWRRESPEDEESLEDDFSHRVRFDQPVMGALPELSARLDHVTSFELRGNGNTTRIDGTLRCFPNLQTLNVSDCTLQTLPEAIFGLPKLVSLELSNCNIHLTPVTARSICDLETLEYLDLSSNPLDHAPDLSRLRLLSSVHLANCQLREMPQGIFQLPELYAFDLSNNQISEISTELLDRPLLPLEDSDLSGNPLSAQSLDRLRQYYQSTGVDFQVPEAMQDAQGNPLQPPLPEPMEE